MRDISPEAEAAAAQPIVPMALLVELEFASGTSRFWSGVGDFVWDGRTFTGLGDLLAVSEIEETAETRSVGLTLQLSGIPTGAIGTLDENERWQYRPARLWLAFFEPDGVTLINDPVQIARNRMDVLEYEEGETATFKLSTESRLVDLERPRIRRYTAADQRDEFPDDLGFDFVESVSAGIEVEGW